MPLLRSFHILTLIFFAYLPWSVITRVFLSDHLGIPWVSAFKELLLILLCALAATIFVRRKVALKLDILDSSILAYLAVGIVISIVDGVSLLAMIAGARFDYLFLVVFLLYRHAGALLPNTFSYYLKWALLSSLGALFVGACVRFVFGETILLHLGFSPYLSQWDFGGAIPIYHGVSGAGIKRFQGIWDGPNPAAYFLIVIIGALFHAFIKNPRHAWWAILVITFSLGLIFLTYSRSALIGVVFATVVVSLFHARLLIRKYFAATMTVVILSVVAAGAFYLKYEGTIVEIVQRDDSSKGHKERFIEGFRQIREHPFGHGLGYSGPAYRYSVGTEAFENMSVAEKKDLEFRRIPESWYIQQFQEFGIFGGVLFLACMGLMFWRLLQLSVGLAWALLALGTMCLVLHTLESVYISLLFFSLIGLLFAKREKRYFLM